MLLDADELIKLEKELLNYTYGEAINILREKTRLPFTTCTNWVSDLAEQYPDSILGQGNKFSLLRFPVNTEV